jgi:SAM-dependent methyltransferase
MLMSREAWEIVGEQDDAAWYLDPLVGRQKQELNLAWVKAWARGVGSRRVLKTDAFEESHGKDSLLGDFFPEARLLIGMDVAWHTVHSAREHTPRESAAYVACDVRALPFGEAALDVVISTSTLDHFDSEHEFQGALAELARVLRPGGRLIISLDNLSNPLYRLLRLACRIPGAPFRLGYTTNREGLAKALDEAGLRLIGEGRLIHNPRLVSTLLFLGLRKCLGRSAEHPIGWLLSAFAHLERLPTRGISACFITACAEKPGVAADLPGNPTP